MDKVRVLAVGLKPSVVDFEKWPSLSPEKIEKASAELSAELTSMGYIPRICLTDTGETAGEQLSSELDSFSPDVVLIGAGVRADEDQLLLFERMLNIIHKQCPQCKIAFNNDPSNSIEAVQRWVEA
ncbi:MAG: hypothetical protein WA949_16120 [Phormidesmis sp.]